MMPNRNLLTILVLAGLCLLGRGLVAQIAAPLMQPAGDRQANTRPTTLAEIVTFSLEDDLLAGDIHWRPSQPRADLKLTDMPGDTIVRNLGAGGPGKALSITNIVSDGRNTIEISLDINPHAIYISRSKTTVENAAIVSQERIELAFLKTECSLSRTGTAPDQPPVTQSITEPTWVDLLEKHPDDVEKEVRPFLESVGLDSLLVTRDLWAYQVLAERITPASELAATVKQLLEQCNDPAPEKRNEASDRLKKLGHPALAVLVHLDRSQLTPEQSDRLGPIIKPGFLKEQQIKALQRDKKFLLGCLPNRDEAVRRAAEQLQEVLGQKIEYDPTGTAAARAVQMHKLRQLLVPTTKPSAQP